MPSVIKKNKSTSPPINGIKLINIKKPDLFVSCNLLTPAEIAGIKVNKVMPKKKYEISLSTISEIKYEGDTIN